jgi:hypothetical protein
VNSAGNWHEPSNWSGGAVPALDESADLSTAPAGANIVVDQSEQVVNLTIGNNVTVTVSDIWTASGHTTFTSGTVILRDGEFDIGADNQGVISAGATITGYGLLANPFAGSGVVEAAGGNLLISDPIETSGIQFKIGTTGTMELYSPVSRGTSFAFEGRGGTLLLDRPTNFHGTVYGLIASGDWSLPVNSIDISGIDGVSGSLVGNSIVLDHALGTIALDPDTHYGANTTAAFTSDLNGGTNVFLYDSSVCFAEGTRILTERGELPVEALTGDDIVITADQGAQPIRWIGHRHLNLTTHPRPETVAPVRIRRAAFAENQPHRDLIVSPEHCLFVDGKLIPAKLLINGMTIVQERATHAVSYYHVELDRHAVLLAEGLPAESYLDTGNRAFFSNAGLALILHPEFHVNAGLNCWEQDACAPLAVAEAAVRPVWEGLATRAQAMGFVPPEILTTDEADLRLEAGGRTFRPVSSHANRFVFVLPEGVTTARIASRADTPAESTPWLNDWRRLGVAVSRIVVRGNTDYIDMPVDHPALAAGWHGVETEARSMWRWTDGNAALPIEAIQGPVIVELHVRQPGTYVVAKIEAGQRLAA